MTTLGWNLLHSYFVFVSFLFGLPLTSNRAIFYSVGFIVHTTPEKFGKDVFTLKTSHFFFVHAMTGEIWKRNNHRSFWRFFFRKTCARKSHYYRDAVVMEHTHTKTQSRCYQIRPLWGDVLGKLRFRNALVWTVYA